MLMAACAAAWGSAPLALAAGIPGPAFPDFRNAAQVKQACDAGLKAAQTRLKTLERLPGSPSWIGEYDSFYGQTEDVRGPIEFISNVHPDQKIRTAAEACELRWQDFFTSTAQNERLYKAAKTSPPADDIDRETLRQAVENFEDSGVGLPAAQRGKAKQLSNRIGELGQKFDKNVRDSKTRVAFTDAELAGVPENIVKSAKRDAQGRALLGLDYPTYFPVMERAESAATRERMWRAKTNEGGPANLKLLAEIAKLRKDYAKLFGFDSYADFTLRRRMAKNTANAERFLGEVRQAVTEGEQRDLAALREAKAKHLGVPVDKTTLARWDVGFYTERLRKERFSVDQESFRPYFPPQESLQFVMRIAETMFGIKYTPVEAKLWVPEAQAYAVSDAATGKPIASLIVDMYPRDGKYGHAAVWSYRSGSTRTGRIPQASLVVNFDRKGLTIEELDTLLHEFGHSLHSNLTMTRYALNSGTSTQQDFVEAPSQMLEDWVFDRKVLALFKDVCPSCKPVPDELIDKAREAREFTKGSLTARQHLYASYDLALHGKDLQDPLALWAHMEGDTPLGYVAGTSFPAGFSHVAGGYGAGYYGYLWSLVVAMDLRTAFAQNRLDPAVGKRYRDLVLSQGGQRPPEQLLKDFLGRETNAKAFFDYLKK
ncbi:MAG TPA: M3 family metallopeptidase [Ideonella sp.]|jgi:thimet oligopeptidase|nr:M3 family metallopeptidase [Ideonella sp.]